MPIHYALFENHLTDPPHQHAAIVQITGSADLEAVARRMLERGSTTTRADILAVLEDCIGACESILLEGRRVNFGGLVELFPRIRGKFDGPTDSYDAGRHTVDVAARPGCRVRKTIRTEGRVAKDDAVHPAPLLIAFLDVATGTTDQVATPGSIGELTGARLKYDRGQADEGVYLVGTTGGGISTKVATVQRNKPGQLVFLVPALPAGSYWLEVRARPKGNQQLRTGRLALPLTVEAGAL